MIKKLKQFFCHHAYEEEKIQGFLVVDGWLVQPKQWRCKKCGKITAYKGLQNECGAKVDKEG